MEIFKEITCGNYFSILIRTLGCNLYIIVYSNYKYIL